MAGRIGQFKGIRNGRLDDDSGRLGEIQRIGRIRSSHDFRCIVHTVQVVVAGGKNGFYCVELTVIGDVVDDEKFSDIVDSVAVAVVIGGSVSEAQIEDAQFIRVVAEEGENDGFLIIGFRDHRKVVVVAGRIVRESRFRRENGSTGVGKSVFNLR